MDTFQRHLRNRRYNVGPQGYKLQQLVESSSCNELIVSQLTLEKSLEGHSGCVNTLDWSSSGEFLLSGSDDTKLNIYDVTKDFELVSSIRSGHYLNILSAYFMPSTSDRVIVSASLDAQIRIFDCTREQPTDYFYFCHRQSVQRLGVFFNNPNEFLSCSSDGTVRHFDLRVRHECSNTTTPFSEELLRLSSFTAMPLAQRKMNRARPPKGCPAPLLDYGRRSIDLHSLSINQRDQNYFAVGGNDEYIYLHDRRMRYENESVKKFTSTNDTFGRKEKELTAVKFSEFNGYELLGSWSNDGIYLFNLNEEPLESISALPTYKSLSTPRCPNNYFSSTALRSKTNEYKLRKKSNEKDWKALLKIFKEKSSTEIIQASKRLLHQSIKDYIQITQSDLTSLSQESLVVECRLLQAGSLIISALARIRRCLQDDGKIDNNQTVLRLNPPLQNEFSSYDFLMAREELNLASILSRYVWKGQYNIIVAYYYISSMLLSFNDILERLNFYRNFTVPYSRDWSYQSERNSEIDTDLLKKLKAHLGELSNLYVVARDPFSTLNLSWDLLDDLQISENNPIFLETDLEPSVYERYDGVFDNSLDEKNIVPFNKKYSGHSNVETMKEVNFFGPADSYIISGSDDGLVYVWDKKTGNIVQILEGDSEVVNVTKGHPDLPILAVSGIDSTIKIMTPKSDPFSTSRYHYPNLASSYSISSRMSELDQIVSANQTDRGMREQSEIDSLCNMKKTPHMIIALGLRLEESSQHNYEDQRSVAE